ncbi:UDP-3-O-acylglucosamine N-acyltransferase [Labeo rohita]|uniref:UDP-3-O-acylglucosamine N-acyltransferase n=1 Tax=Labeo rohita TaxID=84645 RepID=A0ABQ8LBA1_LABRO|nr:UDP-3-O-acylglucosamine N-acyltransferase [Labeo rohita]
MRSEHAHTHTVNTHPEQWAPIAPAPGEQLGVQCLASVMVLKVERALFIHNPHLQFLLVWELNQQPLDEVEKKFQNERHSVTLNPHTEIQRDDQILWMFGAENELIAQIRGETVETYDKDKKRFKDTLNLDKTTGSLTITNLSAKHTGLYELKIISSSGKILYKDFSVSIKSK